MADVQTQLAMEMPDAVEPISVPGFDVSLIALSTIRGLGTKGVHALFDGLYGELGRVWHCDPEGLRGILQKKRIPGVDKIVTAITGDYDHLLERAKASVGELSAANIRVIPLGDLPAPLRLMPSPPRWLFVEGNPEALYGRPAIAVVGTREPTPQGMRATSSVVRVLAAYPITLVSGLADGIDAQAHMSSLANGIRNVAFLGHGIKLVFPKETEHVRKAIVEQGGAVASEYLPDEYYRKSTFVERNRLQAALADLVIPVEANAQSGTAHTVRFARQFNRPLVGIRWEGASGILAELESANAPIIDIFTAPGRRRLDSLVRELADQTGAQTYALRLGEECLMREIRSRAVRREDFERAISSLRTELERIESGADA